MTAWRRFHNWPAVLRWPAKLLLLLAVCLVVLFPKVWMVAPLIERVSNLESVLQPDHPALAGLESRVRAKLSAGAPAADALKTIEQIVYRAVPYSHDWDTWGQMEWVPTVDEIAGTQSAVRDRLSQQPDPRYPLEEVIGQEDCDGRAVVAASLLRRLGYEAWLVTDLLHMWVETPQGEAMSPTSAVKVLRGGGPGSTQTEAKIPPSIVQLVGRGLSYGVAVFPLWREVVIFAAVCLLTLHPRLGFWRFAAGCLILWVGLDAVRDVGKSAAMQGAAGDVAMVWVGAAAMLAGWLVLAIKGPALRPRSTPGSPG